MSAKTTSPPSRLASSTATCGMRLRCDRSLAAAQWLRAPPGHTQRRRPRQGHLQLRNSLRDEVAGPRSAGAEPQEAAPRLDPSGPVLRLWQTAQAVCFDIDCTLARDDQLDLLAAFLGKGPEVAEITSAAMEGTLPLEAALSARLDAIDCTPADIRAFLGAHPAEGRLSPVRGGEGASPRAAQLAVFPCSGATCALGLCCLTPCAPCRRLPRPALPPLPPAACCRAAGSWWRRCRPGASRCTSFPGASGSSASPSPPPSACPTKTCSRIA